MAVTPATPADASHRSAAPRARRPHIGTVLLLGLLAAAAYAAFAGGAVGLPRETWLEAGLVALGVVAAIAWLGPGSLRAHAAPAAIAGVALLVVLAAWTGVSLAWSVAPADTWVEVNRTLAYALVAGLAIAAGSAAPRAIERAAAGWLVIATAVALYALAGKVMPGVVEHARDISRLRAPLEYWNALALVCVLGVPVALRAATAVGLRTGWRIAALLSLFLLLCCLGMTLSRGGVVALVVAVVVVTAAGGPRLRGLAAFAAATLAAAPVLVFAWRDDALSTNGAPRDELVSSGLALGATIAVCGALLAAAGWWLVRIEARARWSPKRAGQVWAALAAVAVALAAGGIAAVAGSERGLRGTIEHAADSFTQTREDPIYDPGRLLTAGSGNRWAWWREAVGAWSDEPLRGWGGGSFEVSRRLYRTTSADVVHAHSLPLEQLAETGAVGALLLIGALGLLLAAAARRVRWMAPGRQRELAIGMCAAAAAWSAHALADWDWDIPGVTMPALLMLGVVAARRAPPRGPAVLAVERPGFARALGAGAACLAAFALLASAVLPAWSDAEARGALAAARERSPEDLEDAAASAEFAARLDPLAVRPLFAAAAVAEARGRLLEARGHLLDAVERQPWSADAWRRLARIAIELADRDGFERASRQLVALDPGDVQVLTFVNRSQGLLAPPEASATATGTPLPPG